jgi:hypothetical protein
MLALAARLCRAGNAAVVGRAIGTTLFLGAGPMNVALLSPRIEDAEVVT